MTRDEIELVRYRIVRARTSLRAAESLLGEKHLHDTVNRLYYACFYAVSALLFTEGQSSSKHAGVRSLFDREWVNTGRVSLEMGRLYRVLFNQRNRGDYEDLVTFGEDEVRVWLEKAHDFVETLADTVEKSVRGET